MAQVTFIIPSFNTQQLTLDCLASIYKYETDCKVIVVDNSSQDDSVASIRQKFPHTQVIACDQNLGFAKANNLAIDQSQSEFIILLNSDTELFTPISNSLTSHFTNSQVGATVPKLLNPDRTIQASVFPLPTLTGAIKEYWLHQPFTFAKYAPSVATATPVEAAVMACMCIPRSVFQKIGKLNSDYFMYFEDLEFCRRLKQNNYQIIYDPRTEIIHHHGASSQPNPHAWKRLIPGSKRYHGTITHYLINFVLRTSQLISKF